MGAALLSRRRTVFRPSGRVLSVAGAARCASILVSVLALCVRMGLAADASPLAVRSANNPLITPASGEIGNNVNGPTVIAAPAWLDAPLDRYYMYFAHHHGKWIRLATAPHPEGPWTVRDDRLLPIASLEGTGFGGHIASPDIRLDDTNQRVILFFHAPAKWDPGYARHLKTKFGQLTGVATSADGREFALASPQALAFSYLRTFTWRDTLFGLSARALVFRSHERSWPAGEAPLEERATPLGSWRHCTVHREGDRLFVFYSRWGDKPERIVASYVDLDPDWNTWRLAPAVAVLRPEGATEGADLPAQPSRKGAARKPVNQLRDPFLFVEDGTAWLYYSFAGEQGIAVARLADDWQERIVAESRAGRTDPPDRP